MILVSSVRLSKLYYAVSDIRKHSSVFKSNNNLVNYLQCAQILVVFQYQFLIIIFDKLLLWFVIIFETRVCEVL